MLKKIIYLLLLPLLAGCAAGPTTFEKLKIKPQTIYRFNNPTLNSILYLRFLPPTEESQELLFKNASKSERVTSLEIGMPGVIHQKSYLLTERGKVHFNVLVVGLYEELIRYHQYSNYGIQQDEMSAFKYRLDMRRAVEHQ